MPINQNFTQELKVTGVIKLQNGSVSYLVWGPGKKGEAAVHEDVIISYKNRAEELEPLGIHGTMVAVDWDSCVARGNCMEVCPVEVFQWYRTEKDIPAVDVPKTKFLGRGHTSRTGKRDNTDKAQPIRESDCIFCNECEIVCPTSAIKINKSNQTIHDRMLLTPNEQLIQGVGNH